MTDATIFNEGESTNDTINQPTATTEGELFTALVGETQKYKTPEDLAKPTLMQTNLSNDSKRKIDSCESKRHLLKLLMRF